jgi:predicted SprT family Zn-dependent metalloprotease
MRPSRQLSRTAKRMYQHARLRWLLNTAGKNAPEQLDSFASAQARFPEIGDKSLTLNCECGGRFEFISRVPLTDSGAYLYRCATCGGTKHLRVHMH